MHRLTLFVLFALGIFGCQPADQPENTTDNTTIDSEEANAKRMEQIAPPPPVCVYLTEAEVLDLFDAGVRIPMNGTRSPGSFNSCQYTLDSDKWTAQLVLEMPEKTTRIQSIRDEVAGATSSDATTIGERKARLKNGGRIISVEGSKPFRVKFSALPKMGQAEPFDEAARRELITRLATAVLQ